MRIELKHSCGPLLASLLLAAFLSCGSLAEEAGQSTSAPEQTTPAPQLSTSSTGAPTTGSSAGGETATNTNASETGTKSALANSTSGTGGSSGPATTPMPAATVEQLIRVLTSEHADPTEPLHNFCDYLKPICTTVDKLTDKCLGMTSAQLKKFTQLSDGKLGQCFMEAYSFDPSKSNVTKNELGTICDSKDLPADAKNSYKSFQRCASKHWSSGIDKEIDRIQVARLEYLRANHHLKDSATKMLAQSDEEEAKVVSEVVEKVLGGETGKQSTSNEVKVLNLDSASHAKAGGSTTAMPTVSTVIVHHSTPATTGSPSSSGHQAGKGHASAAAAAAKQDKKLMNDTNTLVMFVDELKGSTNKPETSAQSSTSAKPTTASTVKTTEKSHKDEEEEPATTEAPKQEGTSTTGKPDESSGSSTAKPTNETSTRKPDSSQAETSTTAGPSKGTTGKPAASTTSSPVQKVVDLLKKTEGSGSSAKPATSTTSAAPATKEKSNEERMEAKEVQLEGKLKEERDLMMKLLKKNQDELESLTAMKALSAQRQKTVAVHDHSDERVHQLEHHRQMSIDPIGHMLKHQQYEIKKKASGR